jgi:ketosteroid isomerase-like protein
LNEPDKVQIRDLIQKYFQIAKSKEIESISEFLGPGFTKFGDSPPYDLRDLDRALMLEQLQFASISDYDFTISDMTVSIIGDVAVAAFALESTGIIVDDYSFRGTAIKNKSRATIVFQKDNKGRWRMLHQHLSKMPG